MIEKLENPFLENDETLICLDTKDIAENTVCDTVNKTESVGKQKSQEFFTKRVVKKTKSIDDTLHKNKLPLFSYKPPLQTKDSSGISNLKENAKFFSKLYVANQGRNCNMGNFFSHENISVPPSLSKDGKLLSGDKTDLLDSLYDGCNTQDSKPIVDGIAVEGPVLINMYQPTGQRKEEYFKEKLEPFLQNKLVHMDCLDVVWEIYFENSLKMTTCQKRDDGSRKKMTGTAIMPRKWDTFLQNSQNKAALFKFISN